MEREREIEWDDDGMMIMNKQRGKREKRKGWTEGERERVKKCTEEMDEKVS